MGWISDGLGWFFDLIVNFTASYGIAIILVTILIRLALLPLTIKQTKSLEAMKQIQPKLEELQKKYKDNPQELQAKQMKLYKDYNVNPFGSCLPMLIQLPILFAFFQVLRNIPSGETAMFLIWDLTLPDSMYILPILSVVTQFIQMGQTTAGSSQKGMMYFMPIFIGFISLNLPAGLVLYWVVGNVFSIGQQTWISKKYPSAPQGGQTK